MSAMSVYIYIYLYDIYIYRYIIYIDSISIIFGVTMCDIPYLSSVSVSSFDSDCRGTLGLVEMVRSEPPDGYCGLPDATASSSSSHSWAPKKTASRNGELMGIYWDLTQVIGSLTIAMPNLHFKDIG